jgi:signal peptidase I
LSQIYVGLNNDTNPFYIYESESMAPILHKGDLIVANYNNTNFNDSKFGDIIIFKATDPAEHNKIIAHRVVKIFHKGDVLAGNSAFNNLCELMIMPKINNIGKIMMTKGDANDCSIPLVDFPVTPKNHIGMVVSIGHK